MLNKIFCGLNTNRTKPPHYLNQEAPLPNLGNLPPGWKQMAYMNKVENRSVKISERLLKSERV